MPACRHGIQLANTLAMLFLLLPSPSLLSYPIHRPSPGFGHFAADVVLLVELVAAITRTLRVSSAPSETVREEPARLHWARQGKVEGGEMRSRCPGRICRGLFSLAGEIMLTIDFGRLVAKRSHHGDIRRHVGKGLTVLDRTAEGQEHRADRIGGARIGDDHFVDRLQQRRLDETLHADRLELKGASGGELISRTLPFPKLGEAPGPQVYKCVLESVH